MIQKKLIRLEQILLEQPHAQGIAAVRREAVGGVHDTGSECRYGDNQYKNGNAKKNQKGNVIIVPNIETADPE